MAVPAQSWTQMIQWHAVCPEGRARMVEWRQLCGHWLAVGVATMIDCEPDVRL